MATVPDQGTSGEIWPPAFEKFYDAEWFRLVTYLCYSGASSAEAEDAAEEAFLELRQRWHEVRTPGPWLRTVAQRLFVRERSRNLDATRRAAELIETRFDQPSSDDHVARNDVVELLRTLPPTQREVMAWVIDGYSPSEIAALLGMSPETARSHLRHARRALVARLMEQSGEPDGKVALG